jgi:hypothetical protein
MMIINLVAGSERGHAYFISDKEKSQKLSVLPAFSSRFKPGTILKQVMCISTVQNCLVSEQTVINDSGSKINILLLMNTHIMKTKLEKNKDCRFQAL